MTRRQQLDHERYLRQRDERLRKQREYYQANREKCRESVRMSERRRKLRLLEERQTRKETQ